MASIPMPHIIQGRMVLSGTAAAEVLGHLRDAEADPILKEALSMAVMALKVCRVRGLEDARQRLSDKQEYKRIMAEMNQ